MDAFVYYYNVIVRIFVVLDDTYIVKVSSFMSYLQILNK